MSYGVPTQDHDMSAAGRSADGSAGLDVWALLARVWARKWFLVLFVLAGVVLAYAALSTVTPHYTGEVRILIEGQTPDATNPLANQAVREADQKKIESEIQVLLSRSLADQVVTQLKLDTWEEFSTTGGGLFGFGARKPANRAAVISAYFDRLNVYQVGESRVIAIDFWAEHPRSAMMVANAIADLYVGGQLDAQVAVTRRASSWLDEQVYKLRAQVQASEAAVSEFRRKSGIFESNGNLLKNTELAALNAQLITASTTRSELQARLDSARALMQSPAGIETSSEVLDNPLIRQLRQQEVALQRQITDLSADLLPQHPDMIARLAELDDLRRAISAEVGKIARRLENDVRVATARERTLRSSIARLKKDVTTEKQQESELRSLEREAAANRGLLESFLLRASEAGARDDRSIQRPEARIISRAETPESPSFPKKGPILMLAFMASLTFGLLIVLATEMLAGATTPAPRYAAAASMRRSEQPAPPAVPAGYDAAYAPQQAYAYQSQPARAPLQPYAPQPQRRQPAPAYAAGGYVDPFRPQPPQQAYRSAPPPPPPPMPAYAAPQQGVPRQPVTQMIALLPANPTLTQHDQWVLSQSAQEILRFIASRPSRYGQHVPGRVVRVACGQSGPKGLVGLARLLAQQGKSVVVVGTSPQPAMGLTDVMSRHCGFAQVMQPDTQSSARFIGWGSIPVHDDPALIANAMQALAQSAQIVLVGDPDSVVLGLAPSFDRASDTSLVLLRGTNAPTQALPQTDTAGLIQIA
ncbi:Wzz/FepE/Etk N-terminal domain-containing protein [Candidatus Phaeomarinobacter ectocarpi]|nr:Wzz/FepE/Etk N-terminal domain-containing protein [Candidatus Phaeomarinobacter ectocarpi]